MMRADVPLSSMHPEAPTSEQSRHGAAVHRIASQRVVHFRKLRTKAEASTVAAGVLLLLPLLLRLGNKRPLCRLRLLQQRHQPLAATSKLVGPPPTWRPQA